jgi:hypothetical protein
VLDSSKVDGIPPSKASPKVAWTTFDSFSKGGCVPPFNPPPRVGMCTRFPSNAWVPSLVGVGTREKRRGEGTKGTKYPLNILLLLLLTFYVGRNMLRKIVAKGKF